MKLHDIPNTVAHGVSSLTRLGASLITLHGQGGPVMMKAAVEAARESGETLGVEPVSYTHLDVYKRQAYTNYYTILRCITV